MEKLPGQRKNTKGSIGQTLDPRESFDLQVLPELGQSVAELRVKSRTLAARRRAGSQTRGECVRKCAQESAKGAISAAAFFKRSQRLSLWCCTSYKKRTSRTLGALPEGNIWILRHGKTQACAGRSGAPRGDLKKLQKWANPVLGNLRKFGHPWNVCSRQATAGILRGGQREALHTPAPASHSFVFFPCCRPPEEGSAPFR